MKEKFYPLVPLENQDEGDAVHAQKDGPKTSPEIDPATGRIIVGSLNEAFILEQRKMLDHLNLFSETEIAAIEKRFLDINQLTAEEYKIFDQARDKYWMQKYGFRYGKQGRRKQGILKDYIISGSQAEDLTQRQKVPAENHDKESRSSVLENNPIIKQERDLETGKIVVDSLAEAFILAQREMLEHLDFFSEAERAVIQKRFLNIMDKMPDEEWKIFDTARDRWWMAQYGSHYYAPFGHKKRVILTRYILRPQVRSLTQRHTVLSEKNTEQVPDATVIGPELESEVVNPERSEFTEKVSVASWEEAERLELAEMVKGHNQKVSNVIIKAFHKAGLSPKEQSLLDHIRKEYYREKYGISYSSRPARIKALETKYVLADNKKRGVPKKNKVTKTNSPAFLYESALETKTEPMRPADFISEPPFWKIETENEIEKMDNKVLEELHQEIVKIKNQPEIEELSQKKLNKPYREVEEKYFSSLRNRMIQKYPDYAEVICALVNLDRSCGWQSLAGHLLFNNKDKKFAQKFWDMYFRIASLLYPTQKGINAGAVGVYRGVMGQLGLCKAFAALKWKFNFATPSEDAREKTDLWLGSRRIQIKHRANPRSELAILETDEVLYPNAVVSTPQENVHIINSDAADISTVSESVEALSRKIQKKVKVLKVVCPAASFDSITGEPTQEFLSKIEPILRARLESAPKSMAA